MHEQAFTVCDEISDSYLDDTIDDFCRVSDISGTLWTENEPILRDEMRKARRDQLRAALKLAEGLNSYSFTQTADSPKTPPRPASAPLGGAIDDYMAEHSRKWLPKDAKQFRAYLNILLEYFGADRPLATITKQDASEVKKILLSLPASRNTKPALKDLPLKRGGESNGAQQDFTKNHKQSHRPFPQLL